MCAELRRCVGTRDKPELLEWGTQEDSKGEPSSLGLGMSIEGLERAVLGGAFQHKRPKLEIRLSPKSLNPNP